MNRAVLVACFYTCRSSRIVILKDTISSLKTSLTRHGSAVPVLTLFPPAQDVLPIFPLHYCAFALRSTFASNRRDNPRIYT
jgi:hypothetical protein